MEETPTKRPRTDDGDEDDSDVTVMESPESTKSEESPCLMASNTYWRPTESKWANERGEESDTATLLLSQTSPTPSTWSPTKPYATPIEQSSTLEAGNFTQIVTALPSQRLWGAPKQILSPMRLNYKENTASSQWCDPKSIQRKESSVLAHEGSEDWHINEQANNESESSEHKGVLSDKEIPGYPSPTEELSANIPHEFSPASQLCIISQIGDLGEQATPWKPTIRPVDSPVKVRAVQDVPPASVPSKPKEVRRSQNAYGKKVTARAADWDSCSEHIFDGNTSDVDEWGFEDISDSDFD
ncbi:Aste57867_14502 [Aphanomyces stellatus]|uniref:Aste57867_14502 protein n=1 Tax=Aphanomyces stellatus TaxID=120398 RepID=A0A485L1N0_9STRA|nr:hypothetical protein As57867_014448 [Aphanomyces stellatus]VFT91324.1 Aste57867_14502 [Aphanomyces stellatus]